MPKGDLSLKVILVGRFPPPVGGNTVHIQRLAHRLMRDGYEVVVFDLYARRRISFEQTGNIVDSRHIIYGFLDLFTSTLWHRNSVVLHVHMSSGGRFYRIAPVLLKLFSTCHRRVLTIHSGSWHSQFLSMNSATRSKVIRIMKSFDELICVSSEQENVLKSVDIGTTGIRVIPAYLKPFADDPQLPASVQAMQNDVDILICTSGYGTSIYDFSTVIGAVTELAKRRGVRVGLAVVTYARWDKEYWDHILLELSRCGIPYIDLRNLDPDQFLALLRATDVYIRSTTTDGDAVAIREAADLGARVVASNAVTRPPGVALFDTGDVHSLAKVLSMMMDKSSMGVVHADAARHYSAILDAYGV